MHNMKVVSGLLLSCMTWGICKSSPSEGPDSGGDSLGKPGLYLRGGEHEGFMAPSRQRHLQHGVGEKLEEQIEYRRKREHKNKRSKKSKKSSRKQSKSNKKSKKSSRKQSRSNKSSFPCTGEDLIPCGSDDGEDDTLVSLCRYDEDLEEYETQCLDKTTAKNYLENSQLDQCGTCEGAVAKVMDSLDGYGDPETAMESTDPAKMAVFVNAVRILVNDDVRHLVTSESVLTSTFGDIYYHSDLFPMRRLNDILGHLPSGCADAMSSLVVKVFAMVFVYLGINLPDVLAQGIAQSMILTPENKPLLYDMLLGGDVSWLDGTLSEAVEAGMTLWGRLAQYFGLKNIFTSMKTNTPGLDDAVLLTMIAITVTNGAPMLSSMESIVSAVEELTSQGEEFRDTCFITACDGETPYCDDGDLCTVDKMRCDSNTDWIWECTHTPKICSPGYSCSPSDGSCKPDDVLVPCVAVIDEDGSFGTPNQAELWDEFRVRFPARPFCLLSPPSSEGIVKTPENFLSDDLTIVPEGVAKDDGDISKAQDWSSMCGLEYYTDVNVQSVGLFIDDSGSMNEVEVAASRDAFYTTMNERGIQVKKVVNKNENWILPFLTTLAPEASSVQLDRYVFWPSYDSEGNDIAQYGSLSLAEVAGICNNDPLCGGFNSNGWLKDEIKPLDQWIVLQDTSENDGLYIKVPTTYRVNERRLDVVKDRQLNAVLRDLSTEEVKWVEYIVKYTIPYLQTSRYEAIKRVAWGALWSLHIGALNGNLWKSASEYTPVSNPFLHSLCEGQQLGPTEHCESSDWQVGIAFDRVDDYTYIDLQDNAAYFYYWDGQFAGEDVVNYALKQTIAGAVGPSGSLYNAILQKCASDERFKKSWLLRNHLIGLSNKSDKVKALCGTNPEHWCTHINGVMVLLQSLADGGCQKLDGYAFWPFFDSVSDDDDGYYSSSSLVDLWVKCNADTDCKGFSTAKYIMRTMRPLTEWVTLPSSSTRCSGLYIKEPTKPYQIDGVRDRSDMENTYLDYIAKYTIPNLKTFHYEAIKLVAWGTLWSLHIGALNGNLWKSASEYTPVSNPFLHSLCSGRQLGPTEVCDTNDWQVGIAFDRVDDYTPTELEDSAVKYYQRDGLSRSDSVDYALKQTIAGAVGKDSSLFSTIYEACASDERLKKSWLVRNHLIGLSHKSSSVRAICTSSGQEEVWCNAIDGVMILLQSLVEGTCKVIELSGYDFYQSKDSPGDNVDANQRSSSLLELWKECNGRIDCEGFNTNGYLKKKIVPVSKMLDLPGRSQCQGIYKKKRTGSIEKVLAIAREELARPVIEKHVWGVIHGKDSAGHVNKYMTAATWSESSGIFINPNRGTIWQQRYPSPPATVYKNYPWFENWCADFVCWVFREAGFPLGPDGKGTAYVEWLKNWLKDEGYLHLKDEEGFAPQPGDIILFDSTNPKTGRGDGGHLDHVGIVESVNSDGSVWTIEGNTYDPNGSGRQGLYRKLRDHKTGLTTVSYGRRIED